MLENVVVAGLSSSSVQVSLGSELSEVVDEASTSVQVSLDDVPSVEGMLLPLALGRVAELVISGVEIIPLLVAEEVGKLPVSEGPTVVDKTLAKSVAVSPGAVEDEGAELDVDSVPEYVEEDKLLAGEDGTLLVCVDALAVVEFKRVWTGLLEVSKAEDLPEAVTPVPVGPAPVVELEGVGYGGVEGSVDEAIPLVTIDKREDWRPTKVKPDDEVVDGSIPTEEDNFEDIGNEPLDAIDGVLVSP